MALSVYKSLSAEPSETAEDEGAEVGKVTNCLYDLCGGRLNKDRWWVEEVTHRSACESVHLPFQVTGGNRATYSQSKCSVTSRSKSNVRVWKRVSGKKRNCSIKHHLHSSSQYVLIEWNKSDIRWHTMTSTGYNMKHWPLAQLVWGDSHSSK